MVIRTRDRLIEVARQLFLIKGIENTTMLDIANAADNGRRTIYTYFKSKHEIYSAVVERESEKYVQKLREVAQKDEAPEKKIKTYLNCLFSVLNTRTSPTLMTSLSAWMKLDFQQSSKIREVVAAKETEFLCNILDEGVSTGVFDSAQTQRLARMLPSIIPALERSAASGNSVEEYFSDDFINFTVTSLTNLPKKE